MAQQVADGSTAVLEGTRSPDEDGPARLRAGIGRLARRLNASSSDPQAGLTPTQVSVLGVVARRGPLGLAELADVETLNPTMLSRVVGRLVDLGLLARSADAGDRRAALVGVTAAGLVVHEDVRDRRTAALSEALSRLTTTEAAAVLAVVPALESLARELTAVNAAGPGAHVGGHGAHTTVGGAR